MQYFYFVNKDIGRCFNCVSRLYAAKLIRHHGIKTKVLMKNTSDSPRQFSKIPLETTVMTPKNSESVSLRVWLICPPPY